MHNVLCDLDMSRKAMHCNGNPSECICMCLLRNQLLQICLHYCSAGGTKARHRRQDILVRLETISLGTSRLAERQFVQAVTISAAPDGLPGWREHSNWIADNVEQEHYTVRHAIRH
jgi:hypothetical protein